MIKKAMWAVSFFCLLLVVGTQSAKAQFGKMQGAIKDEDGKPYAKQKVYIDREDVRVVDDSVLNVAPGLATVNTLVRQVPRARVDDICIPRIDCERFDVNQSRSATGRQGAPRLSRVV